VRGIYKRWCAWSEAYGQDWQRNEITNDAVYRNVISVPGFAEEKRYVAKLY